MEISKSAETLLAAFDIASGGRVKIELYTIRAAFLSAFPQWQGSADRRERLRVLLDELSAAERVRLPGDLRRAWEPMPAPSLPKWLMIVRQDGPESKTFDHRTFPWVDEMVFVSGLRTVANPEELSRIHEFLKDHPERRPIVPVKERSFQLFGDEKRLDTLRKTKLFDAKRLTLALLRCRDVPASLQCVPAPNRSSSTWLIVENEAAFHSFIRLNRRLALHAGIVLGSGRNVLRAVDFLATLNATSTQRDYLYFGDIDRDGIEIPALLDRRLQKCTGHRVIPAEQYYDWLLSNSGISGDSPAGQEINPLLSWFSPTLGIRVQAALARGRPLVQEAIGWEFLSAQYNIARITNVDPEDVGFWEGESAVRLVDE
jgi:hypothetical protein